MDAVTRPPTWDRPWFARAYRRAAVVADRRGAEAHRRELLAGLNGRVLELGVGCGLNFRHYPATVRDVIAVEPERGLRAAAENEARHAAARVRVTEGRAEALPCADASVDAVVASLVLCSVADLGVALEEIRRVLQPTGRLRFYEHVRSSARLVARLQHAADRFWPQLAGGCHIGRDTPAAIGDAGFAVASLRGFTFRPVPWAPAASFVIGEAYRR